MPKSPCDYRLRPRSRLQEHQVQRTYPGEYAFLLKEVYGLHHSDYRVDYNLRSFTSVDEILKVMAYAPGELSLKQVLPRRCHHAAGTPNTTMYMRPPYIMYPDTPPIANLNAANAAMTRGDLEAASRYLTKADNNDPTTIYARGILRSCKGEWDKAHEYFCHRCGFRVAVLPQLSKRLPKSRLIEEI